MSEDAQNIKSILCPTCYGPLPKAVLTEAVQCIYCDVWVATCDGRQQKMILDKQQREDLRIGIQPDEPVFTEDSPLDRLFGRIRRVSPIVIGFPMMWVLMMHLYVGMGWVGHEALPLGSMDAYLMWTFFMCVATTITGYSILTALTLASMSVSSLLMLLTILSTSEDPGSYMESESGIIAMFYIGTPMLLAIIWGMMQGSQSMKRYGTKLWTARYRFAIAMTLGLAVSYSYFSRPTTKQFLYSKRPEFEQQIELFTKLCSTEWSEETPSTEPINPQAVLKYPFKQYQSGNIETVLCSRTRSKNWVSNYLQDVKHRDLRMGTQLASYLSKLYAKNVRDSFLHKTYIDSVNTALSPTYWLLYDAECLDNKPITGKLYDVQTQTLLRRVQVPCTFDEMLDRKALLDTLMKETDGVFIVSYD